MYRRTLLATALLAPLAAHAQTPIAVTRAWSRATMANGMGVAYLTITASGAADALVGVSTPVASKADLHESFEEGGVMKMRPVASLAVTPGKPVVLQPGGYHIMLMGLTHALKEGDTFPLTLQFAKAGAITVTATVGKAGASGMSMPSGTMPGMKM